MPQETTAISRPGYPTDAQCLECGTDFLIPINAALQCLEHGGRILCPGCSSAVIEIDPKNVPAIKRRIARAEARGKEWR